MEEVVDIGLTRRDGNDIVGYGSIRPPYSGRATIVIQRERWFGWEDVKSETVTGSGYDHYIRYNCSGTGVYNYRTWIVARRNNDVFQKFSNVITENC
jgi:hypothetical protein